MPKKNSDRTFVNITNKDIYDKFEPIEEQLNSISNQVKTINGSMNLHRQWLIGLTTTFGVAFTFIITLIFYIK